MAMNGSTWTISKKVGTHPAQGLGVFLGNDHSFTWTNDWNKIIDFKKVGTHLALNKSGIRQQKKYDAT